MHTQEPRSVTLEPNPLDCWAEESTASALRALAVRLHASGLSFRETAAALETFGVTRSYQAVFQWVDGLQKRFQTHRRPQERSSRAVIRTRCVLRTVSPLRVGVDETAVTIGTGQHWLYAAIDVETNGGTLTRHHQLNEIRVELMGAIQKRQPDGTWEQPVDITDHRVFVDLEDVPIPVLTLQYEATAYEQLGRSDRVTLLAKYADD